MDKLAKQLRQDADNIDVEVSDELDRRIDASLRSVQQAMDKPERNVQTRPALFWWASSLTGIAAATAVIIVINSTATVTPAAKPLAAVPPVELNVQPAMLTGPLRKELEKLQSDLEKAEAKVRDDIGL